MAKPYYVIAQGKPPVLPLPSGSIMWTVNSKSAAQALRAVARHIADSDLQAEVIDEQKFE
jgi:hypothetical protein